MKKMILIMAGVILIAAAPLWYFWLGRRWIERIPPGWQIDTTYVGTSNYADPQTGQFQTSDDVSAYQRTIRPVGDATATSIVLEDNYTLRDVRTGEVIWGYTARIPVDRRTGAHLQAEFRNDYFVFPRNVKQQTYSMRFSFYQGLPLSFQGEDEIEGLRTYVFAYHGAAEYTKAYASTDEFQGLDVEPGQEIRCADDQLNLRLWVEPVTGEFVKIQESCLSGDYVYDRATNQALYPIATWSGVTSGDSIHQNVDSILNKRAAYLWAAWYLPGLLLLGGLLALGAGIVMRSDKHLKPVGDLS